MSDLPSLLERRGPDWSITYDLTHTPTYLLLTMRGRAAPDRTQALLDLMHHHLPHLTNPEGRLFPIVMDLREEGPISTDGLKMGWSVISHFGSRVDLTVFVIDPHRPDTARLRSHLGILARLVSRLVVANSMEEALAKINAHHRRSV
jgi:hypothetical protein